MPITGTTIGDDGAMPPVELERRAGAATIRLNRPEALNAWDGPLAEGLRDAVREVAVDDAVRAVCVTGAGRAFSSGADLRDLQSRPRTPEGAVDVRAVLDEVYHPIIRGLREMPKPVVAAVNGPAVGIGCSLALAADLVVARESSFLMLAFVGIGLAPDGGSSLFIPARVGFARAAEMALLGERVPARQALEWGLVNRVVADDAFEGEVAALVDRLAAGPSRVHAAVKRELNAWLYARMEDQLALEAAEQGALAASEDFAEGVRAFLEKRPPAFEGR
jgi:2-(1,2-epoxy-1,2-dihydrophenyl)acetyl-CoA isomerase